MLRLKDPQLCLWDVLLPPELCQLSDELAKVDKILSDDRFLAPFLSRFNVKIGRPTVPVETYLRLMYLKYRYGLGYEVLVQEVSDSVQWRRFCRIPLTEKVPHSTTLIKLTKRFGPKVLEELNQLLVHKAYDQKIIRGRKLQVDTTVVEANIHHPTDASLLQDGVRAVTRLVKKLQAAGMAVKTTFRDRQRSVRKKIFLINKVLKRRSGEVYQEVRRVTGKILVTTKKTVKEARLVLEDVQAALKGKGQQIPRAVRVLVQNLEEVIRRTEIVIAQTEAVQAGNRHIPDRMVSIFDPHARPIIRGKAKAPVEFGYKVLLQEAEHKIVTGYQVYYGNPADDTLLSAAVERHIQVFGCPPRAIAADRGFSSPQNEKICHDCGIKKVSLPRKGRVSEEHKAYQGQNWFKRLQRWRAGGEATISLLKRKYGLRRTLLRGYTGARLWVGFGILTYNLRRIAACI
jgi:IS5 family transposase